MVEVCGFELDGCGKRLLVRFIGSLMLSELTPEQSVGVEVVSIS